jgi:hypothetical protein
MTGSIRTEVIEVYSRHTVRDKSLYEIDAYKRLCRKYDSNTAFDALRHRVETDKIELEGQMRAQTPASQVKLALMGVFRRRAKQKEEQDSFVELVMRAYGESWSDAQRAYFREASAYLRDSQDYFLSFTNRNLTPLTYSRVNEEHEYFIRKVIREYKGLEWKKRNLLAQAIHYILQKRSLTGFFFPEHGRPSYEVIPELEHQCQRALVFIQVVQGVMFTLAPSYCNLEFNAAKLRPLSNSVILLDAEEAFLSVDRVDPELLPWYESVRGISRIALPLTNSYNAAQIRRNGDLVNQKISELVDRAADLIYEGVPAE